MTLTLGHTNRDVTTSSGDMALNMCDKLNRTKMCRTVYRSLNGLFRLKRNHAIATGRKDKNGPIHSYIHLNGFLPVEAKNQGNLIS